MQATRTASLILAIALLATALVAGCAAKTAAPVALTAADNGSTQQLAVGQQLTVTLEANPTTGYQWAVDGALPAQLTQVGEPSHSTTSSAIGAGGTDVWTFQGASAGQGTLKMKYWRSFEPTAPPVQTFEVSVDVK